MISRVRIENQRYEQFGAGEPEPVTPLLDAIADRLHSEFYNEALGWNDWREVAWVVLDMAEGEK